ncbi:hypothetical protein CAPTEDRAFT_192232 [Capitella teleta]|uniref:Uncharacterized protein n=1 Tax=Capitella teleta TaxID=283909 RepID=R7UL29_CAPTE|nr:hypothetical protein CAPTEDRAFT_192232 [Capitella teleta]|eukprot:ELU04493.1 hypothetical protein CAPTEDRAFT_192232 [Capitella teleta]
MNNKYRVVLGCRLVRPKQDAHVTIVLGLVKLLGLTVLKLNVGGSFMHQLFSADEASKLSTCVKSLRIRLEKDSKQWEETELTNAIHKDASSGCNSYKHQSEYVYGNSTNIFGHPTKPKYQSKDVTLMVHLTSDRIEKLLRLTENWSGPISAAIYVDNITDSLMIENICHFQSRPNIFIHILHKVGGIYPSSIIRNLALEEVFTEYAFLSDVDFMPAPSVYKTSVDLIKSKNRLLSKTTAFVVAAFELKRNITPDGDAVKFPRNKSDLLALQNSTLIQPFHYHPKNHFGHFSTNYEAWNIANTTYQVCLGSNCLLDEETEC